MGAALHDRNILVTGAAKGIGAALCEQLSKAGAHVIGVDRDRCATPTALQVDLSDPQSVALQEALLPEALHGVACVAGVPGTCAPDTVLRVNFLGLKALFELCLPRMEAGASAVFVSSITAHRCTWTESALEALTASTPEQALTLMQSEGLDGPGSYELSKRVLNHWVLTRLPAFAERGVRANLVSPGPVETGILADFEQSMGKARIDAAASLTGRHGQPHEIAAVIGFLLSPDSAWVNGAEIKVDGGFHALRSAAQYSAATAS